MPLSLKTRSTEPEMMDTVSVSDAEFHQCLQYMQIINSLTLAYRPTLSWIKTALACARPENLTIYDIGCGGGDMLRKIQHMLRHTSNPPRLTGIDMSLQATELARKLTPAEYALSFEASNIFSFTPDRRADLVISSLFAHHLTDTELIRFIQWMEAHTTTGWFINDFHRHFIPYWFIKYTTALFCPNRLIVHDAPLSVARSFRAADWQILLAKAGVPKNQVCIRWHFPFRYCVSRWKNG